MITAAVTGCNGVTEMKIEGFFPVTVTPFNEAGDLMLDRFEELMRWHLDQGAEGLCIGADNGESWALTPRELGQITAAAVKVAAGRVPVLAGAMGTTTISARSTIKRAAAAAEAGADAVLVSPQPYVMRATTAEIVDRYASVGKAVNIPIVAYNSPRHFGFNIEPDVLQAICDAADIVGLKEASREFNHTTTVIRRFGEKLCVFVGPGWFILPGIALGARGFLSTGPELLGKDAARIIPLAREAPCEASRRLHEQVTRCYRAVLDLGLGTPPAPIKAALNLLGLNVGVPRAPIAPLDGAGVEALRQLLQELDIVPAA